jgi:8-hydroxy-5-deazaflavin:NADPH oxidoreductase
VPSSWDEGRRRVWNKHYAWIQDFSSTKHRTFIFTSGDDAEAKQLVIELIEGTGLVAIDLGSLGVSLCGLDLHLVRRLR